MSSCLFTESQELADEDARYEAEYGDCCDEYTSQGAESCPLPDAPPLEWYALR